MFNFNKNSDLGNANENYYTILGIEKTASREEIRKAYRKLSLNFHPDRNAGDLNKSERYKKINEAYCILSDDIERKNYDLLNSFSSMSSSLFGSSSINIDPTNTNPANIDPTNIMNMFMNSKEANHLINDLASKLPINAMMSMMSGNLFDSNNSNNSIKTSKINNRFMNNFTQQDCFSQHNDFLKPESIFETINITLLQAFNGCKIPINITKWKIDSNTKFQQEETLYIDIPKGVDNNEIIILENKGNRLNSHQIGDIEIKILINNNTSFLREGLDLIYKKTITLKESYCGFSFDLPYIDGREFKINNKPGNIIPNNFRKIIPQLGLKRDNDIGNLLILFEVIYPKQFSEEQLEKLKDIL